MTARDITVSWGRLSGLAGPDVDRISRLAVHYVTLPVTATLLADGSTATLAGVDFAVLAPGTMPNATTTWTASTYSAGVATAPLAGSLVVGPPTGSVVVPDGGAGLWARVSDTPEVDVHFVALITPF